MFSKRAAFDLTPNSLAQAIEKRPPTWDLTSSNPTNVGLDFPVTNWEAIAAISQTLYAPAPRGLVSARTALGERLGWNPEHLVLSATTSDAYSLLIKLFCDPGDRVVIPEPSYPLLPMLTRLEGAVAAPYVFRYDGEWHLDRETFREVLDSRTKLIIAVSPNNPTGAFLREGDLAFLLSHGLPVVVDEVFAAYDLRRDQASPLRHTKAGSGLLFALGGLSKAAALPQAKLSWMAVSGDEAHVESALRQLDVVADTYLSVNDRTQHALPALLTAAVERRRLVFERVQQNRQRIVQLLRDAPEVSILPVEGGWYQILRLPRVHTEEAWVLSFLDDGVLVQPGWFYDFRDEAWVILSLLTPTKTLSEGLRQLERKLKRGLPPF